MDGFGLTFFGESERDGVHNKNNIFSTNSFFSESIRNQRMLDVIFNTSERNMYFLFFV